MSSIYNSTKSIEYIEKYKNIGSDEDEKIKKLKNKILLRRADSYSNINDFEKAKIDLKNIENQNEDQNKKMEVIYKRILNKTKDRL